MTQTMDDMLREQYGAELRRQLEQEEEMFRSLKLFCNPQEKVNFDPHAGTWNCPGCGGTTKVTFEALEIVRADCCSDTCFAIVKIGEMPG